MSTADIKVPALGESVAEATIARWYKQVGEAVQVDEILCELETDKVAVEIPCPVAGKIDELLFKAGDTVTPGAIIGRVLVGAAGTAPKPAAAPSAPVAPAPVPAPAPTSSALVMPSAAKIAADAGVDTGKVSGTGKDGRVTKGDVLAVMETRAAPVPSVVAPSAPRELGAREERVRMTRLRQTIARRLKDAQNTAAMLTTFNEIDMTAAMAVRQHYKDLFEKKHGVKLGFMSMFAKACVMALKEIPAVNGEIDGTDIIYKNHYDIGIAVGTEQGLVVPVVRDADIKGFAEIEKEIGQLGKRARDGKLKIEELQGGTFTITNGGIYGSLMSTPILNPPQSGIIGLHKIQDRPMVVGGQVVVRPMMYVALSYDHRMVDGREAVTFLVRVKECMEDPQRILFDI
jgi:2-oxoglutarate dehydrogenase E2 component (dihydrolipoamide succinyltransferase)